MESKKGANELIYKMHVESQMQKTNLWLPEDKERGLSMMYIVTLLFLNLYSEYIIQKAELNESQAGIKIAKRNINSLR